MLEEAIQSYDGSLVYLLFIYHISYVCYMQSTWTSQSMHKIENNYKSTNTLLRLTQVPVKKTYKNHPNALI